MLTDAEAIALLERDGSNGGRRSVKWPTTPEGWCAWFRALDIRYGTGKYVPGDVMHHDYRCPVHGCKHR